MKRHYTVKEAAKLLGVSTNTIYSYLDQKKIEGRRIGKGRFKIPYSEVLPFVESPLSRAPSKMSAKEIFGAFQGSYYGHDFVFFKLFLSLVFLGEGILTLLYRLSLFTPFFQAFPPGTNMILVSWIFFILPFVTLIPGILLLSEIFWKNSNKYQTITNILIVLVSAYSAYFAFVFGGYEVFSFLLAVLIIFVSVVLRSWKNNEEALSFDREFLRLIFLAFVIFGVVSYFKVGFPTAYIALVALLIVPLFFSSLRQTTLGFTIMFTLAFSTVILAIYTSEMGKWLASYFLYLVSAFELFLLWWRREQITISEKISWMIMISLLWSSFVIFLGVLGVGISQRAIIDARVERIQARLGQESRDIKHFFDTADRRITTIVQKQEVTKVVLSGSGEPAISAAREIFDSIPNLRRVLILNQAGRVLGAYPRDPVLQGAELGDRDYFQTAKSTLNPNTSGVFVAITSANIVVRIYPLVSGGKFIGAIVVVPDLATLSESFNEEEDTNEGFYGYDLKGNYVLNPDPTKIGYPVPKAVISEAQGKIYRDINTLRIYEKMTEPSWTLYVESQLSPILQRFMGINLTAGVLILFSSILGFGTLSLLIKQWTKN